jgi:hypothetical protein
VFLVTFCRLNCSTYKSIAHRFNGGFKNNHPMTRIFIIIPLFFILVRCGTDCKMPTSSLTDEEKTWIVSKYNNHRNIRTVPMYIFQDTLSLISSISLGSLIENVQDCKCCPYSSSYGFTLTSFSNTFPIDSMIYLATFRVAVDKSEKGFYVEVRNNSDNTNSLLNPTSIDTALIQGVTYNNVYKYVWNTAQNRSIAKFYFSKEYGVLYAETHDHKKIEFVGFQ